MGFFRKFGESLDILRAKAFGNIVINNLNEIGEKIRSDMWLRAPTQRIAENIYLIPAKREGDRIKMTIWINTNPEGGAPEAPAYEFGSGIHGEKGDTYPIAPRNEDRMIFDWEPPWDVPGITDRLPWIFLRSTDPIEGVVGFPYEIQHPGVEERPYANRTIDEYMPEIEEMISLGIERELMAVFSEIEPG